MKEKVMFVGMDVWHGSNNEVFSVGGLIFSLDTNLLKIYSAAVLHEWRQEIFNSIRDHFVLALKAFVEENKQLPDRVMIYRDGVLRRDYKTLLLHELKQYMEVIDMLYVGRRPFLSMVVVQKRVYERFFAKLETGKYVNSPPGTVIDHDMTRKRCYDFFLNSMYRKKGTTIPTHYVMVYDNSNMSPDVFHQVTYSLCYSYFNWPGTFYVPSVVQYAHKLASHVVGRSCWN
ncbi:unnamed protein product [Allacma fusca]|uniref:Piwi domain-containing protein n=1 Tax=Allacma fusca TaxID=39272 RepID=A0A8J2NV01_9HEXA|nr:unnamed protein product [Allacma fusca]